MKDEHEEYMRRCIKLGIMAKSSGSTPVGALVVKNKGIIAEGFEGEKYIPAPIAHAEIIAVLRAIQIEGSKDLSYCTLYTTKEPCYMCSYLIRQTKIKEVVFAMRTEEAGGISSEYPILTSLKIKKWNVPPAIIEGILKNECEQLLK